MRGDFDCGDGGDARGSWLDALRRGQRVGEYVGKG